MWDRIVANANNTECIIGGSSKSEQSESKYNELAIYGNSKLSNTTAIKLYTYVSLRFAIAIMRQFNQQKAQRQWSDSRCATTETATRVLMIITG